MKNSIKKVFDLKNIYIIVFITLAGWSFFAYFTMTKMINSQEIYGKIINLSGKQRMLSQKTTLIAKRYFESKDILLKNHLKELIDLMKSDHEYIIKNLNSDATYKTYFDKPTNLHTKVQNYVGLLNKFYINPNSILLKEIEIISYDLLPKLNDAVYLFEKESEDKIKQLHNRERFILFGTLLTLLFEALIIVIPSIRRANKKEKELKELNQTLEEKINKALKENRKKDKLLEQQFHIKQMTEMMSNIAHQWRQPLSVISTIASALKLEKELGIKNEKQNLTQLDEIIKKTNYLSSTINNFTDFLKQEENCTNIDLENHINQTLLVLKHNFRHNKIKITKEIIDSKLFIFGDTQKFSLVLLNIISNSKDFLLLNKKEELKKWIKIKVYKNENYICIEIEDNAGGIKEEDLEKVFDIYFTTKHQSQGTGLGLYISYEIIKKYFKGDIKVKNTKFGALFTIKIPVSMRLNINP